MSQPALTAPASDLCRMCAATEAHPSDLNGLCNQCATELAMDRASMDAEDCRVGLCAGNCGRDA